MALLANAASAIGMALAIASLAWLLATGRATVATTTTAAVAMVVLAGRLSGVSSSLGQLVESGRYGGLNRVGKMVGGPTAPLGYRAYHLLDEEGISARGLRDLRRELARLGGEEGRRQGVAGLAGERR